MIKERLLLLKLPLGDSEVFVSQEGESLPGDCSPKSDTTLKRSLSLCQEEEKMPTYSAGDDDATTTPSEEPHHVPTPANPDTTTVPSEEPPYAVPKPAIPVSKSFDSSESEAVGSSPVPKEQQVKTITEDPSDVAAAEDHSTKAKQKISIGQKFQHYTRVPQLRKDVSVKMLR